MDKLKSTKRISKITTSLAKFLIAIYSAQLAPNLNNQIWDSFYQFYLNTVDKKWGGAYLTKDFFYLINEKMSDKVLLVVAKQNNIIIAAALNFIGKDTLFGRNWGALVDIPFLHFELCYYQAIEFAIEQHPSFLSRSSR